MGETEVELTREELAALDVTIPQPSTLYRLSIQMSDRSCFSGNFKTVYKAVQFAIMTDRIEVSCRIIPDRYVAEVAIHHQDGTLVWHYKKTTHYLMEYRSETARNLYCTLEGRNYAAC